MEHWWNNNGRENLNYSEKNLSQTHSVLHKSHINWSDFETGTVD
jgi:hypothetical protein